MGKIVFNFVLGTLLAAMLIGALITSVYYTFAFWIWVSHGSLWGLFGAFGTIASVAVGFCFAKDEAAK